jgi:hypothetical protein
VQRHQEVPVEQARQAAGIEDRGLPDDGGRAVRLHLELQPRAPRQLHLGHEAQHPWRLHSLDAPEVQHIPGEHALGIAPPPPHADAAREQIEEPAEPPQPVGEIPAGRAADAPDRREGLLHRRVDAHRPRVDAPGAEANLARWLRPVAWRERIGPPRSGHLAVLGQHGACNRLAHRARHDGRKEGPRAISGDDRVVPDAVDQLLADASVDGSHESEPETRQPRREHRHADHPPAESTLGGVLAHQILVGYGVGPADLDHLAALGVGIRRGGEIGDDVLDRDRLRQVRDPPGHEHHRQPLHQGPNQLEREAAGSDDDRGAELQDGNGAGAQDLADFLPARQVRRQRAGSPESAEIDDAAHPRRGRGLREVARRLTITLGEILAGIHRVDEVVRRINAPHGRGERIRRQHVALHDLHAVADPHPEVRGTPRQAPEALAAIAKGIQQPPADVAARARQQHQPLVAFEGGGRGVTGHGSRRRARSAGHRRNRRRSRRWRAARRPADRRRLHPR